ncbi:MAG TPA: hypothetical protein PKE16_11155 [Hyphomicrobium sp.]|nr:hypothetical protein [Hyphomicrobium sp.]
MAQHLLVAADDRKYFRVDAINIAVEHGFQLHSFGAYGNFLLRSEKAWFVDETDDESVYDPEFGRFISPDIAILLS